jgi:ABC-type lipoprotein export system ATPase subunit
MVNNLDFPIEKLDEDLFGYKEYAQYILSDILETKENYSRGLTVGINGVWGSGKSSLTNLIQIYLRENHDDILIVDFNPWSLGSGGGDSSILQSFFIEIGAQFKSYRLKENAQKIVKKFGEYGAALSFLKAAPIPGLAEGLNVIEAGSKLLGESSVGQKHEKLKKLFSNLESPIIVFIDDVDRLTSTEVKELFKLVRQTANFPNLIYVISYDSALIAQALEEPGVPGSLYIQKIIQTEFTMPNTSYEVLADYIYNQAIENSKYFSDSAETRWYHAKNELAEIISNFRDAKRVGKSIKLMQKILPTLDIVDLIILEAIKKQSPDDFNFLSKNYKYLTGGVSMYDMFNYQSGKSEAKQKWIDYKLNGTKHLIEILFPGFSELISNNPSNSHNNYYNNFIGSGNRKQYQSEGRISSSEIANYYFSMTASEDLKLFYELKMIIDNFGTEAFRENLYTLNLSNFGIMLAQITNTNFTIDKDLCKSGLLELLGYIEHKWSLNNQLEDVGFTNIHGSFSRAVNQLVGSLESKEEQEEIILDLISNYTLTFSSKVLLLSSIMGWWRDNSIEIDTPTATRILMEDISSQNIYALPNLDKEWMLSAALNKMTHSYDYPFIILNKASIELIKYIIRTSSQTNGDNEGYYVNWDLVKSILEEDEHSIDVINIIKNSFLKEESQWIKDLENSLHLQEKENENYPEGQQPYKL